MLCGAVRRVLCGVVRCGVDGGATGAIVVGLVRTNDYASRVPVGQQDNRGTRQKSNQSVSTTVFNRFFFSFFSFFSFFFLFLSLFLFPPSVQIKTNPTIPPQKTRAKQPTPSGG
jgi:hypothetical protein